MSQDQESEEVKPEKLNLNISYDRSTITVKVRPSMAFSKIFAAAEQRFNKGPGTFKFTYNGTRIQPTSTPAELEMVDGDGIDAFLEQTGGDCGYYVSPLS